MKTPEGIYLDDPAWPLVQAQVSYWGITDAAGNAGGTTLACADLANEPGYVGHVVKILSGASAGQRRGITIDAAGVVTVGSGFTNSAGAAQQILAGTLFAILELAAASAVAVSGKPNVNEVIIYPVAPALGVSAIADDGLAPAYYPAVEHSTAATSAAVPGVAWSQLINFEQDGPLNVISIYAEFEWQTRFVVGAGAGTKSSSKLQMSRDGGANWVDVTDQFDNAVAIMTNRKRAGVGLWLPTIVAGVSQLGFRLIHWTDDIVGAVSTSKAQIRSNSYIRLTYRKG